MNVLLRYAVSRNLLPFYLFYSVPDENTKIICGCGRIDPCRDGVSLYLASAYKIKGIADTYHKRKLSKNSILEFTNAFSCLFCCPEKPNIANYFKKYFPSVLQNHSQALEYNSNNIPPYVQLLLNQDIEKVNKEQIYELIREYQLFRLRNIAVLDVREK
jgi:hypothetical protein